MKISRKTILLLLSIISLPVMLLIIFSTLIWSGITPNNRFVWFLEVLPVIIGMTVLITAYFKHFEFTMLVYCLIFIHALILIIGGHYTYEFVPVGMWVKEIFNSTRNHYDRLGHFAQGFIPAMIAREVFIRKSPLKNGFWLIFSVISFCLAFSALFELFEWFIAVCTSSEHGNAFLGMQGDPWDTQWDMFLCLLGAILSLSTLSHFHDKQLKFILKQ